jgi:5-formyltetrahydrofolate cyclo-ligase
VPRSDAVEVVPEIVVTPFLAADPAGRRVGYGAGFYDMTLRELRRRGPVRAIGVGYDAQIVEAVPVTERDERLDLVITERRTIVCGPGTA